MSRPVRQQGVALITVLLVVAMATVAAVAMTRDSVLDQRRTGNILALEQAWQLALGGERWVVALLAREAERPDGDSSSGSGIVDDREQWPRPLPPVPIQGGSVSGVIADAQARFNINSLVGPGGTDPVAVSRFQRLLATLGLDRRIAMAAVDWIDRDRRPTYPGGGEDNFYLSLPQPYRVANQPMASATELRRVRGVDAESWRALAPYVTALPRATPINVSTASPVVLQAIVPGLESDEAEALAEGSFRQVDEFVRHPAVATTLLHADGLTVESHYFRSRIDVQLGPLSYTLYTWLQRDDSGLRVLRRARTPH